MNANDVILHLLDKVIQEKEKSFMLNQELHKYQHMLDEKADKD